VSFYFASHLFPRATETDLPMVEKQNETKQTNKRTIIIFAIIGFTLRKLALFDEAHLFFDVKPREEEAKTLDDVLRANIYSTTNSRESAT
jgi:hypothetical protein